MSVLIRGVEMPKNCWSCRMFFNCYACEGHYCRCAALGEVIGKDDEVLRNKRRDDCPLVPVPPHGRLIDADALTKELEIDDSDDRTGAALLMAVFLEVLKSAHTIIPAEPCNNLSKPCKEDEA